MKKAAVLAVMCAAFIFPASVFPSSFPPVKFELIGGDFVSLPSDIKHDVTLVALSFKRPADGVVESWTNTFAAKFTALGRASYYQVAVIGDVGFIGGFILGGMRSGATEEQKKHLAVCWENKKEQLVKYGVEDESLIYVYLLDRTGNIALFKKGLKASGRDIEEILSAAERLLDIKNKKGEK